jgi:hypothetical protein
LRWIVALTGEWIMSLERKMARHGPMSNRTRAIKKGTPYRRLLAAGGKAVHATKGRVHDAAVLQHRMQLILQRAGASL